MTAEDADEKAEKEEDAEEEVVEEMEGTRVWGALRSRLRLALFRVERPCAPILAPNARDGNSGALAASSKEGRRTGEVSSAATATMDDDDRVVDVCLSRLGLRPGARLIGEVDWLCRIETRGGEDATVRERFFGGLRTGELKAAGAIWLS